MNHCITEPRKNLLFLVKDPMLTSASTTAAYAGKMLWDRAWLHRFTDWVMGIWSAAGQSHQSVIKPCSAQFAEPRSKCHLCRGRTWLGYMGMVCLVLGWMEQGIWEGFWRDWCCKAGSAMTRVVSHGKDQIPITRSAKVVEQRNVSPAFSMRKWRDSLWTCQQL